MTRIFFFSLCVFFFLPALTAIPQMAGYYPKGGPDNDVEDVSMIQPLANPQAYDNKRVRITGDLHLEFEGNAIYLPREDFDYAITKNSLWINIPKDVTKERADIPGVRNAARVGAGAHGGHQRTGDAQIDLLVLLFKLKMHPLELGEVEIGEIAFEKILSFPVGPQLRHSYNYLHLSIFRGMRQQFQVG